ncbi:YHYH protein [Glaciecola petra]|uniref:Sulfatase-like hydrolase/transferase n=1 Tax=Glaciecola petra TaxID=3075602 RepID=A0ABU2ZTH7_9ALTE|nr:YHYH protein [Aestuariibacter sp. P117]MDT0595343.1 sulfatase-like hydrolase/transferase [Aestuariibacter sp. P117]
MIIRLQPYFIVCILSTLTLVACGGGGGGEASEPTPVIPPVTPPTTPPTTTPQDGSAPNILFILSDDQGLDASAQYSFSTDIPTTPNINALADSGLVFENAWATPACTTTRATIITGKYGFNSGVTFVPALLTDEHETLQAYIKSTSTEDYASAVFGKWHLGGGNASANHPSDVGIEYFAGNLSNISDYNNWELTINGATETSTDYHTTVITDLAIEWIGQQTSSWFTWLAYAAPHSPFHLPPASLHSRNLSGTDADIDANTRAYYLSAIEAMDTEIGRLLNSLSDEVRDNTIIIFMGDNGTPRRIIDTTNFDRSHAKGSLYQGGVGVPLVISGKGVERQGERETALVTATDLYATIAQIAGVDSQNIHDSNSFMTILDNDNTNDDSANQDIILTSFESANTTGTAIRNSDYKVIEFHDGSREVYDISANFTERSDLINDSSLDDTVNSLLMFAESANGGNSTNPDAINITNAIFTNGSGNCAEYMADYTSNATDVARNIMFVGDLSITLEQDKCVFLTNAIPNHDFNDGGNAFPNDVSEQDDRFEITIAPEKADTTTALSLVYDNAILLNGVKVDILAAGCFGVGDGRIGCNDITTPWRYDPMHPESGFNVDSHNAHAQGDGTYHYHGSPFALFADDNSEVSPVIGFAADGFPIYGSYIQIDNDIRKVLSSYRLKTGDRPSGDGDPGGQYNGTFRDDYEYIEGLGDLDECNGMTVNGEYAYYITDAFPYVLGCFSGTPDESFNKR